MTRGRDLILYDGDCCFCRDWMAWVRRVDVTGRVETVDLRGIDVAEIDPRLTARACRERIHLVERRGRISSGFEAFQRLSLRLPLLWISAPVMHLPGIRLIGTPVYDWIARMRFRLSGPR